MQKISITPTAVTPGSTIVFLSARERQVLCLVCQGASTKAAAAQLGLAPETVKQYLRSLYCGLRLSGGKFELTLWAQQYPQIFAAAAPALHSPGCECPAIQCSAMRAGDPAVCNPPLPRAA